MRRLREKLQIILLEMRLGRDKNTLGVVFIDDFALEGIFLKEPKIFLIFIRNSSVFLLRHVSENSIHFRLMSDE
jgi:hypothetical protein